MEVNNMRYEMNKTGKDNTWSILDLKTGKYVLINETHTICSNVLDNLNRNDANNTECGEIARAING